MRKKTEPEGVSPKAVIYARYSSDNQREESIDGQLRECRAFAARQGYIIVGEYVDRAYTGRNDNRPDFQRMLADSGKHVFDVILVWKLDRFARNKEDAAINKALLKRNGVKVVSATEAISDGPEGILVETMLEGIAQFYSAELAQKVTRGHTENALKAKVNGGSRPLGLCVDSEQHYQIDPVTAPIILEIFTRYADGELIKDIAEDLNRRGLTTARGTPFKASNFIPILKNRAYIGEYHYADITIPGAIPPIVPEDIFERAQRRIEQTRHAPARMKAKEEYILSGKLFCGLCGTQMVGESGTSRNGTVHCYYKCLEAKRRHGCKKKAVRKGDIERLVVLATRQYVLSDDDVISDIADKIVDLQEKGNVVLPMLQRQLAEVQRKLDNLVRAIEEGLFSSSTKERLDALESSKAELLAAIDQEKLQRFVLTREQIINWVSSFKGGDVDDLAYRKTVCDNFVNSVYLYDDGRIEILFNGYRDAKRLTREEIEGSDLKNTVPPNSACST